MGKLGAFFRRPAAHWGTGLALGLGASFLYSIRGELTSRSQPFAEGISQLWFDIKNKTSRNFRDSYVSHFDRDRILASDALINFSIQDAVHQKFLITNFDVVGDLGIEGAEQHFQNAFLAALDTQMGIFSMLFFQQKLIVTAHLSFDCFENLISGSNYTCFTTVDRHDDRSLWVHSSVLNRDGGVVAAVRARFVKISGF